MFSELQELYQELIIDHGRKPRNCRKLPTANTCHQGHNPLCGDKVTVYLYQQENVVREACFEGSGCAISIASASLMTEAVQGRTFEQVNALFAEFHCLVTQGERKANFDSLGKLAALAGVAEFPMRVKCATLAWHTLLAAMRNGNPSNSE